MNRNVLLVTAALLSASVLLATGVEAQKKKATRGKVVSAGSTLPKNTGLLGIHLMDPATRVLSLWGSPSKIEPIQFRTEDTGGGGGGGGNVFGGGNPDAGPGAPGGPPVAASPGGAGGGPGGLGKGGGGQSGPGAMAAPGMPGMGGGGAGGFEGEVSTKYTRWIYKRGAAMYAFIVDDSNRVIQIDASGLSGAAIVSGGIRLGSSFSDVMRVYKKPDGYTFKGEIMEMRFLVNSGVLFQLHEDGATRTQRVVYISVSAGK